jgi:hypothetical protein
VTSRLSDWILWACQYQTFWYLTWGHCWPPMIFTSWCLFSHGTKSIWLWAEPTDLFLMNRIQLDILPKIRLQKAVSSILSTFSHTLSWSEGNKSCHIANSLVKRPTWQRTEKGLWTTARENRILPTTRILEVDHLSGEPSDKIPASADTWICRHGRTLKQRTQLDYVWIPGTHKLWDDEYLLF